MRRCLMVCLLCFSALGVSAACGPQYPNCERDEHCPDDEHCVFEHCQQCRHANDCSAGQRCIDGRCE